MQTKEIKEKALSLFYKSKLDVFKQIAIEIEKRTFFKGSEKEGIITCGKSFYCPVYQEQIERFIDETGLHAELTVYRDRYKTERIFMPSFNLNTVNDKIYEILHEIYDTMTYEYFTNKLFEALHEGDTEKVQIVSDFLNKNQERLCYIAPKDKVIVQKTNDFFKWVNSMYEYHYLFCLKTHIEDSKEIYAQVNLFI